MKSVSTLIKLAKHKNILQKQKILLVEQKIQDIQHKIDSLQRGLAVEYDNSKNNPQLYKVYLPYAAKINQEINLLNKSLAIKNKELINQQQELLAIFNEQKVLELYIAQKKDDETVIANRIAQQDMDDSINKLLGKTK